MHPTELVAPTSRATRRAARGRTGARSRRTVTNVALLVGTALVAASALIHLYLWADGYRRISTIGPLFLAQGIAGLALAVVLVAYPRVVTAAAGLIYALATLVAFAISASGGLFGFQDKLDAPWAANALVIEIAALLFLLVGAALPRRARSGS